MYLIKYSGKSIVEIDEIYDYIAEDNNLYAIKVIESISNSIKNISIFPYLWTSLWIVRKIVESKYKFVIVYEIDENKQIITIISIFQNKNNF